MTCWATRTCYSGPPSRILPATAELNMISLSRLRRAGVRLVSIMLVVCRLTRRDEGVPDTYQHRRGRQSSNSRCPPSRSAQYRFGIARLGEVGRGQVPVILVSDEPPTDRAIIVKSHTFAAFHSFGATNSLLHIAQYGTVTNRHTTVSRANAPQTGQVCATRSDRPLRSCGDPLYIQAQCQLTFCQGKICPSLRQTAGGRRRKTGHHECRP